jgi:hypothetical protein
MEEVAQEHLTNAEAQEPNTLRAPGRARQRAPVDEKIKSDL